MSVDLLNILKNEAKYSTDDHTAEGHWIRRKEAQRARRGARAPANAHKRFRIRRELATAGTDAPDTTDAQPALSRISAEWSGATGGPPAEVVLRLHPAPSTPRGNSSLADLGVYKNRFIDTSPAGRRGAGGDESAVSERRGRVIPHRPHPARNPLSPSPARSRPADGSGVVVRAEEALIVAFVLLLWVAAIALFFNRWGKIRMLEPYQPKFQQQHRQSCALAENSVSVPPHHRASLSRGCVSYDCGAAFPSYQPCGYLSAHRPRQNSVFVGSMALIPESPPRRSRSAADLPALVPHHDVYHSATPRSSRAASLHSTVDLRVYPSPRASRAASLHSAADMPHVQVHARGSGNSLNRPRSPRRLTITNV